MPVETTTKGKTVSDSITRPANTTAYAAGDVVDASTAAGLTFTAPARGETLGGYIVDALLVSSANKSTKGDFELWLFDTVPGSFDADNAVFTPTDAEMLTVIGIIQFTQSFVGDATADAAGNSVHQAKRTFLPLRFDTVTDDDDLYGVLVVRNAYTPVSAEVFTIRLKIDRD